MAVTVAGAVATVVQGTDGTENVPVLMSAVIAAAELSAGANGTVIDPDFTAATITAITLANPGVFTTSAAHGLVVNDKVYITGIVGTTQANNRAYTVNTVPSTTTFTLKTERGTSFAFDVLDTSTYTARTSGGTVYRLLYSGQLIGIRVDVGANPAAWLKIDDNFTYVARTSTRLNPAAENALNANNGGAVVLGYRSTSLIRTTTSYNDANCYACQTGGRFFSLRTTNGESPSVIHEGTTRNDWPTMIQATAPAEYRIEGLTVRSTADSRKMYGGNSRNIGGRDLLAFYACSGSGDQCQSFGTTYRNIILPNLQSGSENTLNNREFIDSTFGTEAVATADIGGPGRGARGWFTDCNFSGWWSGLLNMVSTQNGSYTGVRYTHTLTLKNGNTAISGANVRRVRTVVSGSVNYNLSGIVFGAEAATTFTVTDGSGISTALCTDAFRGDDVAGVVGYPATERYNWGCRIRKYDFKTFSDDLFTGRVYGQGGLLSGVTEEFQCAAVPFLSLTEAAAAALTDIALVPSGATGGTATLTATRTIQELWEYYRQWIVQTANFTSDDTWNATSTTVLNFGGWTIAGTLTAGGAYTYLGGVISVDLVNPTLTGGTINIGAAGTFTFSSDGTIVSMTPAAPSTYTMTGTHTGTLDLRNASATHAITVVISAGTAFTTAGNTGAAITVVFADDAAISITGMPTVGNSIRLQISNESGRSAAAWTPATPYALGAKVRRTSGIGTEQTAGLYFVATTAGTSGGTEPTWDTTVGNTTADGSVVWTCYAVLFYNADPVSASYSTTYFNTKQFSAGDSVRVRFAALDAGTSFKIFSTNATASAVGFSVAVDEVADPVYAANAVDGSSAPITGKFTANFASNQIDLDANIDFALTEAYAYFCYELTLATGMYFWWGGVTALDVGNYRNSTAVVSIYFDETAGFVKQTDNARWFRDDGVRPALDPTTGGNGLEINWRNPVYVSGVTTAQGIRDAMKLAPTAGTPAANSVDAELDTIKNLAGLIPATL